MAPLFKVAQFVDVLINGDWKEAIVQAVRFDNGVSYLVCLIDQGKDVAVSEKNVRASARFEMMLSQELDIDMPDPSQHEEDDFVDPVPLLPAENATSRFQILTESEIDALQRGSKSASTHKHTQWALKIFRGE